MTLITPFIWFITKHFAVLLPTLLLVTPVQAAPASTNETHFCEETPFNEGLCVAGGLTLLGVLAILLAGDDDKPEPSGGGSNPLSRWGEQTYADGKSVGGGDAGTPVEAEPPKERVEDGSTGCAWGDRDFGTCH